jgi:hypothetical protein
MIIIDFITIIIIIIIMIIINLQNKIFFFKTFNIKTFFYKLDLPVLYWAKHFRISLPLSTEAIWKKRRVEQRKVFDKVERGGGGGAARK